MNEVVIYERAAYFLLQRIKLTWKEKKKNLINYLWICLELLLFISECLSLFNIHRQKFYWFQMILEESIPLIFHFYQMRGKK